MNEFGYEELEAATQSFSPTNLIGRGSHGCVYKGFLKDGTIVAIKKQSLGLQKLQDNSKLDNEVRILSSLPQNSSYLINLLGTSHDSVNNKLLVMEHMPNGTLHDSLHSAPMPPPWPKRVEIAIQIARALQFLHESKPLIIHRDIKTANILFDSAWNAKLADFGLAVRMTDRVDSVSRPAGTIGYIDPSYTSPSKLSTKNDIYSFGVVVLEIISCTRAIDVSRVPAFLVKRANLLIKEHRILDICDKRVALPQYMESTILMMLNIAIRCVSIKESYRPRIKDIISEMENCVVERIRYFPIWMKYFIPNVILVNRRRKIGAKRHNNTTTIVCAAPDASDISSRKLLLREILADLH